MCPLPPLGVRLNAASPLPDPLRHGAPVDSADRSLSSGTPNTPSLAVDAPRSSLTALLGLLPSVVTHSPSPIDARFTSAG